MELHRASGVFMMFKVHLNVLHLLFSFNKCSSRLERKFESGFRSTMNSFISADEGGIDWSSYEAFKCCNCGCNALRNALCLSLHALESY